MEVVKTGRLVYLDVSKAVLDDVPSLQEMLQSEMSQKIKDSYDMIVQENNLDPAEYEPVIEWSFNNGDDLPNNRMQVKVSARQKIKHVPND